MIMKRSFGRGELQYKMADKWKADCAFFAISKMYVCHTNGILNQPSRVSLILQKSSEVGFSRSKQIETK